MGGSELLPADASTLIYLAKADDFGVASLCVGVILVPPAVWRESVEDGERLGYPDAARIREAEHSGALRRVDLAADEQRNAAALATGYRLGIGESEVLALVNPGGRALVDEGRASRVARTLGIRVVSSLFLPVLGRQRRSLGQEEAVGFLQRLAVVTGARADVVFAIEQQLRKVE